MYEKLGKSQREKDVRYVASVAAFNEDGLLLFGRREDNGKWSLPGGHFEPGEWPTKAATRELWEETALVPLDGVEFLGDATVSKGKVHVFAFKCVVTKEPNAENDPDGEFVEFRWVKPERIPQEIMGNLHSPKNVTLQKLGLQEETLKNECDVYWGTELRIPTAYNPKRLIWDEQYRDLVIETFCKSNENILDCYVDVGRIYGANMAVNKDRVSLYKGILWNGEELPPVVLRYDSDGLNLVDGNHRQEAALQVGTKYIKALLVWDESQLEKAVGGIAGMFATGLLLGGGMNVPQPTAHSIEPGMGIKAWTPDNLHEDLYPIAQLESSGGKNLNHAPNPAGEYHTAFGALGFKPSTAHEEYKKSPLMMKGYPGLADPATFMHQFKGDPKFYNLLASAHFARLKARHGDVKKAAYAWRHGSGAAQRASPELMDQDPYVIQYQSLKAKK